MKRNELAELHSKTVGGLRKDIRELQRQLAELDINYALQKEPNVAKKKQLGKDLARTLTVLGENERNMIQSPVA